MKIAICLIVKNEEDCIVEWILHYANIGFDHAIIYDNGSIDKTATLVSTCAAHIDCRVVEWVPQTWDPQLDAYNDCLKRFGKDFDWIAFFDIDELLVSPEGDFNFKDKLAELAGASAIGVNWLMFGSNGKEDKGEDLMMEAFTARGPLSWSGNRNTKAVVRPAMVNGLCNNPHWIPVEGPRVNLDGQPLVWARHDDGNSFDGVVEPEAVVQGRWRLHHYYTRGERKWAARLARGQFGGLVVTEDHRAPLDRSDERDTSALPYAAAVRRRAEEIGVRCIHAQSRP